MKYLIIILTIFGSTHLLYGQDSLLFQKYNFDSSYKVIGVSSYNQEKKVYFKDFSFYVFDLADLNKLKSSIKYGKPIERPTIGDNDLSIYIVKGKEIQNDEIYISPEYSNINIDGKYYEFDISQLTALNKKYPISYTFNWTTLKSENEFKNYISSNYSKKKFLCYQDNTLEFGGICDIFIDRNAKCTTGRQGIQIIKQKLLDLGYKETDFLIGYMPTGDESKKFKLTLQATKDKYDKLKGDNFQKSKWTANDFEILSYWQK
ncbi:MAG: hypothetical protein M9898_12855 [Chitinophagaceae bacterium]|nr:hypothetical protein [Chitinophagaceae bacterium]